MTVRGVKVIATYLGDRRDSPPDARGALEMLRFILDREQHVDPGQPMDTLLVLNDLVVGDACSQPQACDEARRLVQQADGMTTRRGVLRTLLRPNHGISFGAFSYAFEQFRRQDYTHWVFTEDDAILVADGYLEQSARQLEDPQVGYVAYIGISRNSRRLPHCHGGVGCARTDTLQRVQAVHGRLPYRDEPSRKPYYGEEGEIVFTHSLHELGYTFANIELPGVYTLWDDDSLPSGGSPERRKPFQAALEEAGFKR